MSALTQWQREVDAGRRSRTTFDNLWRAACQEAAGRDFAAEIGKSVAQLHEDEARWRAQEAEMVRAARQARGKPFLLDAPTHCTRCGVAFLNGETPKDGQCAECRSFPR